MTAPLVDPPKGLRAYRWDCAKCGITHPSTIIGKDNGTCACGSESWRAIAAPARLVPTRVQCNCIAAGREGTHDITDHYSDESTWRENSDLR